MVHHGRPIRGRSAALLIWGKSLVQAMDDTRGHQHMPGNTSLCHLKQLVAFLKLDFACPLKVAVFLLDFSTTVPSMISIAVDVLN